MKIQKPGEVKFIVSQEDAIFQTQVQEAVNDGFVPFSNMTESDTWWSLLMMKPKIVEIDPETGEEIK